MTPQEECTANGTPINVDKAVNHASRKFAGDFVREATASPWVTPLFYDYCCPLINALSEK
jgi:hypothetical protein